MRSAQVVSVGKDPILADDDPGTHGPAPGDPDDARPDGLSHAGNGFLHVLNGCHSVLLGGNL